MVFKLTLAILFLCLSINAPALSNDPAPTIDTLVRFFDTVVFGNEMEPDKASKTLARWSSPIIYALEGAPSPEHIKTLGQQFNTVTTLTDIKFQLAAETDRSGTENMTVLFVPSREMALIKFKGISQDLIKKVSSRHTCYFLYAKSSPQSINRSFIIVNNGLDIKAMEHCLLEEITQSMGLPNDTNMLRPSLFSDSDQLNALSRNDEIILRTLYDNRLTVGLARSQSLLQAEIIISDWNDQLPLP